VNKKLNANLINDGDSGLPKRLARLAKKDSDNMVEINGECLSKEYKIFNHCHK